MRQTFSPNSPVSAPVKVTSRSTKRRSSRVTTGTLVIEAHSTTQLEAPNRSRACTSTRAKLRGRIFRLGFLNPRVTSISMESGGKSNPFGEGVDLVLLPRFPRGHQVPMAREGELGVFVSCSNGEREWKSQPFPEEEEGYL